MIWLILAAVSLTSMLQYGSIFEPVRKPLSLLSPFFRDLFKCSMCLGFWTGTFFMFANWFITGEFLWLLPFISSGASLAYDSWMNLTQEA